jgi:hypothetical protein
MHRELTFLESNLLQLQKFLTSTHISSKPFEYTSVLFTTTNNACTAKLQSFCAKLENNERRRFGRAKWPLIEQDHRSAIGDIRGFANIFQFALTIDGWFEESR